jgi:NAD(P)-dependent dehydrogenase (short-subunit alcohol dehydrogenase family)
MTDALRSMRFAQKNVLITGAAAGLGRHIAQAFAEGADIAILDFQDASATAREITALKRRCESSGLTCATKMESRKRSQGRPSSSAGASMCS